MAPPGNNPAEQGFSDLLRRQQGDQVARLGEEYGGLEGFKSEVFGAPNTTQNPFARNMWERLQAMPGYEREEAEVMLLMRRKAEEIFAVMRKKLEAQNENAEETRKKLAALDAYLRTIGVVGEAVKMQSSPYVEEGAVRRGSAEVLESDEAVMLRRFSEYLSALDVEELINMVLEDQRYINMLIENGSAEHEPIDKHDLSRLRRFILGMPEKLEDGTNGKEKSENRKLTEVTLWLEIVRSLSVTEKRNLAGTFLNEGTAKEAEDFIFACVIGGVMSREDVLHIYGEEEFARKLGPDFPKRLDSAVDMRKDAQKGMAAAVDRVENVYVQNFANHFITFNNLVMGRIAEIGVLTAGVNLILDVSERYSRRGEADRKEGRAEAVVKGIRDAGKNWRFWLGVGEAVGGSHFVWPWVGNAIRAPSGDEKETVARSGREKYVRDELRAHPAMDEYFLDHYDAYLATADPNKNPKQKNGKPRASFDLYPGDVEMTDEQAGKLGYRNASAAIAAIHGLFTVCANGLKQENAVKLERYLAENVWEAPDPHKHA